MKVEEFYNKVKSDKTYGTKSRVLVIRNRLEQRELRKLFEERPHEFGWVRFSKCVTAEAFVPPPESVFALIREAIVTENASGKMAYVTGLSAMLAVWDCASKISAFDQLRNLIDDTNLKFFMFVNCHSDEMQQVFSHPRYLDGRSIIAVGELPDDAASLEIRLVSNDIGKFMDGVNMPTLSFFINEYEVGGFNSQPMNIRITPYLQELAGVGGAIKQVFREGEFLRLFCNYQGGLSDSAERWLFTKMMDSGKRVAAKDFAQKVFFQGDMVSVCREAPRMILGCTGEEREVLVWMLRLSLYADRYLYKVLYDPKFQVEHFKNFYVNEAICLIGAVNERALCAERKDGIATILQDTMTSLDAEIADFIELSKDVDSYQLIPWLTNQTKLEKEECLRRLRKADLKTIPASFYEACPILEHYLAPYALGNAELEAYFSDYRAEKIANKVTKEFCERARNVQYPLMGVKSRDDLLNDANDGNTALLIVDAMGLEYLPLIVSLSKRFGLDLANAIPASVRIPTSTKFNPIIWPGEHRLNGIPDLDNIIHNGVHVHGKSSDEENFCAMLNIFPSMVMPAIAQALAKYKRVVLTADHGASRLAVLASRAQLAKSIPAKGVDDSAADWRYIVADPNTIPPSSIASNIVGDYWVMKGYDRFSKSGGKLNELHGGLTYEEVLVPFVVFEKGASFVPEVAHPLAQPQIEENEEFDL